MGSKPVGISASRGAAVLGESDYQSVFEIWQRIMEERRPGWNAEHGMIAPPEPDSAALRWGTAFEDAIVELAEAKRAEKITDREAFFSVNGIGTEPYYERVEQRDLACFITCHIDGSYIEPGDAAPIRRTLHEGKTTTAWAYRSMWGEPGTDHIPRTYQIQTQHQMLCTRAEADIVSCLVFPDSPDNWEKMGWLPVRSTIKTDDEWMLRPNGSILARDFVAPNTWASVFAQIGNFHQYVVTANRDLQKLLVDGYTDFWHKHVLEEREPEIDKYSDILRALPEPVGTIVLAEQEERWMSEYRDIKTEISPGGKWGKRCDELKVLFLKAIRARIGDAVLDDESREKLVFRSASGHKLGQYFVKAGFRVNAEKGE